MRINADEFEALFNIVKDVAHIGYWEWDIKTNQVLWSQQKIEIYGENVDTFEPSFDKFLAVLTEETKAVILEEIDNVLSGKKPYYDLQHKIKLKNGKIAWVHEKAYIIYSEEKEPLRLVGIVHDITDKMLTLERLNISQKYGNYLKTHDQLTNLLNTTSLCRYLEQKEKDKFFILLIEIDDFRIFNNTFGYLFCDIILQNTALRLTEISKDDAIFRYGSNEFILLVKNKHELKNILLKIEKNFKKVMTIQGNEVNVSFCKGISQYPQDAQDAQECIRHASAALSLAQEVGKNKALHYKPYMSGIFAKKHLMLTLLQKAIEDSAFSPYFQAKVNAENNKILGFEALMRWKVDEDILPITLYFDIAKEHDFLNQIDLIILDKSLQQLKRWHQQGLKTHVSVNFTSGDFDSRLVHQLLEEYIDYVPFLTIEVTENELMHWQKQELNALHHLKSFGAKISLDDFGTGYSSLQYIHKLPIDELKIDRVFVANIPKVKRDMDLVKIIKTIVDTFELNCVVEGVETQGQKEFFIDLGITTVQGYLYSRPVPAIEATKLLQQGYISLGK